MAYTTVANMRVRLGNVDSTSLPDATISAEITIAESIVDSYCSSRYVVPFTTVPGIVQGITEDICCWRLYLDAFAAGIHLGNADKIEKRYDMAMEMLADIRAGKLSISGDGADLQPTAKRPMWSNLDGKVPVFNMDHETKWGVDSNELDDVEDDRDDADSVLPRDH